MIKPLLLAAWVSVVSLGSAYGVMLLQASEAEEKKEDGLLGEVEYVMPKEISVPVIVDGQVTGYVLAQFVFTVDSELLKKLSLPPNYLLNDEAFKVIYDGKVMDFMRIKKQNLPALAAKIIGNLNKRMNSEFVKDVLIEQLKYLPKSAIRSQ